MQAWSRGAQEMARPHQYMLEPLAQFPGCPALPRIPGVGVPLLLAQAWLEGSWDPACSRPARDQGMNFTWAWAFKVPVNHLFCVPGARTWDLLIDPLRV